MLGQTTKENHRIKYELVVEQINVSCSDQKRTGDINHICLQLYFSGLNFEVFSFDPSDRFI